jgi:hypothetical protein
MEKENNTYENELDIESVADDDDADEFDDDIEEYNFNDEEDEFEDDLSEDEDEEAEVDSEEVEESTEDDLGTAEEEKEEEVIPADNKKSDELTREQKRELALLHKLGYEGNYEEATAAFDKETAEENKNAMPDNSSNDANNGTEPTLDYEAMARNMLDEINRELGLNLTNYADFEDLATFADLSRQPGVGPVKAFKATNPKMMENIAVKAAMSKLSPPKKSAPALPKMDGGKGGASREENISSAKIAEYRQMFPNMSRNDIIKLIKRGNKNIR